MKRIVSSLLTLALGCAAASAGYWSCNLKRISWPSFATVNQPFTVDLSVENPASSTDSVRTLEMTYSPTGGTPSTITINLEQPIAPGTTDTITVEQFACDVTGKEVFGRISLGSVNSETNYGSDAYIYLVCGNRFIHRNLVVEEQTGIDCGYCPAGIVGMGRMRKAHPDDTWIGISVFRDSPMCVTEFDYLRKRMGTNVPNSVANRDFASNYYPTEVILEDLYQRYQDAAAMAGIRAAVTLDQDSATATLSTQTFYAFDEIDANYRVAYTIVEDSVGPYYQLNFYYYDSTAQDIGDWGSYAYRQKWYYDDVARAGSNYSGVEGSIPSTLYSDDTYDFTCTVDLSAVTNTDKASIVVMVVNSDGQIENAVRRRLDGSENDDLSASLGDMSSIRSVNAADAGENGSAEVVSRHDLQGRRIDSGTRGIVVERLSDGTARKRLLR
jgi:hypothetical protein